MLFGQIMSLMIVQMMLVIKRGDKIYEDIKENYQLFIDFMLYSDNRIGVNSCSYDYWL